jgi:hypothetical protein
MQPWAAFNRAPEASHEGSFQAGTANVKCKEAESGNCGSKLKLTLDQIEAEESTVHGNYSRFLFCGNHTCPHN